MTKVFSQSRVNEKTVDACHLRARTFTMEADLVTLTCEQVCSRACFLTLGKCASTQFVYNRKPQLSIPFVSGLRLAEEGLPVNRKPTVLASRTNRARFRGADLGAV